MDTLIALIQSGAGAGAGAGAVLVKEEDDARFIVSQLCVHVSIVRVCELAFYSIIFMVCTYVGGRHQLTEDSLKGCECVRKSIIRYIVYKGRTKGTCALQNIKEQQATP